MQVRALEAPGSESEDEDGEEAPDQSSQASNVINFEDEPDAGGPSDPLRAAPKRQDIPSFELFGAGGRGGPGHSLTLPEDADQDAE
jgi:hypothetical protein